MPDATPGNGGDDLAKHLSFFVPAGFSLTKTAEIMRIHNEGEALRIERDEARAEVERLRERPITVRDRKTSAILPGTVIDHGTELVVYVDA